LFNLNSKESLKKELVIYRGQVVDVGVSGDAPIAVKVTTKVCFT